MAEKERKNALQNEKGLCQLSNDLSYHPKGRGGFKNAGRKEERCSFPKIAASRGRTNWEKRGFDRAQKKKKVLSDFE